MVNKTAFLMFLILGLGLIAVSAQTEEPATVKKISGGVLNGKAQSLPIPAYPAAARAVGASGAVNVQVTIDETGNVISAAAVSGHPLLRQAAEQAARQAKFAPTLLSGQPVSVTGVLVYSFVGDSNDAGAKSSVNQKWLTEGFLLGFTATNGVGGKVSLPAEFSAEQDQLNALAKLSPEEQKAQLPAIISVIKSKLSAADLWRFEFGLAKGEILGSSKDDNAVLSHLAKFRELALSKPEGITEEEMNRAVELGKIADKGSLTAEDKRAIFVNLR